MNFLFSNNTEFLSTILKQQGWGINQPKQSFWLNISDLNIQRQEIIPVGFEIKIQSIFINISTPILLFVAKWITFMRHFYTAKWWPFTIRSSSLPLKVSNTFSKILFVMEATWFLTDLRWSVYSHIHGNPVAL